MRRDEPQHGFTLIEIVVVILIIAVAMTGVALALGNTSRTSLRSSTWTLVSASRYAYSRAVTQGVTVRIVLDFDKRTIQLQETDGRVVLNREDETGTGLHREGVDEAPYPDAEDGEESVEAPPATVSQGMGSTGGGIFGMGLDSSDSMDPMGDMMSGVGMGQLTDPFLASMQGLEEGGLLRGNPAGYRGPKFAALEGKSGEPRDLEGDTVFQRVYTPHEPSPREDGRAYVYFFPGGTTEHTIIQLSDNDEDDPMVFSVEIHPLNGRAVVHSFEFEPEEELDDLQEADE